MRANRRLKRGVAGSTKRGGGTGACRASEHEVLAVAQLWRDPGEQPRQQYSMLRSGDGITDKRTMLTAINKLIGI